MLYVSPPMLQVHRPATRFSSVSGLTMNSITSGLPNPQRCKISSSFSATGIVLGNPSKMNPLVQSGRFSRSSTIPSTISSGTRSPRSIIGLARKPNSVPRVTASRNMSPVERCGKPSSFEIRLAWVPFPAPGGPKKISASFAVTFSGDRFTLLAATATHSALAHETVVIPHDQLRFELLHRIHRHTDHDQQRRAAEIKLHVQPGQNESREVRIEPHPHQRQMLQMDTRNHPFRQQANDRQVDAAYERQPRQNPVDVVRSIASRPDARNKPAVLPHVVGQLRWIKNNPHVEEREKDNQRHVDQGVERLAPLDRVRKLGKGRRLGGEK